MIRAFAHRGLLPALAGLLLLPGCADRAPEEPAPVVDRLAAPAAIRVSPDPWVLAADRWDDSHRGAYLANGYLGQRFSPSGAGWSPGGPDTSHVAGHYLKEALVTMPPLLGLRIEAGGRRYGAVPEHLRSYSQELRLRQGLLVTRSSWDTGSGEVAIELEAALLRQQPDVALLRARLENRARVSVSVALSGPGDDAAAGSAFRAAEHGVTYRGLLRPLGPSAPEEAASGGWELAAGQSAEFAAATHVSGRAMPIRNALPALPELDSGQVELWLDGHRRAWEALWQSDIEIDGDPEAQEVVRACLFYLLASIREEHTAGMPPMGLSAPAFLGHVFWDMDSWMFPALLPQHPSLARAMLEYRSRTLQGARANAREEKLPGASYAWESAATGRETLAAVFRHGRHVSGDVALALRQYYRATGDRDWLAARAWPILRATADNWVARAVPADGGFVIRQVTTPDENAGQVDHSAWTHHVAAENLRFAAETARLLRRPADPRWEKVANGLTFLRAPDTGVILSYAGFTETKKAKQADALLLVHPGEAALPEEDVRKLYDFYAPRVIRTGPAMTDAIHAIVAARLGRDQEAEKRFRDSYRPFVRPPFHLFSEKRTRDNLCFLTGAAGTVEAVLYGFAGLRLEADPSRPGRPRLEPRLPASWSSLRLRRLQWRGRQWDVELKPGAPPTWTPSGSRTSPASG